MQYTYPEIRDQIMIYAEDVRLGRHHNDWGRCTIVPRGKANEQNIKNFLAQNKIKYDTQSGGYAMVTDEDVDYFVFDFGQNPVIDTTIREMADDDVRMRNLNNRILKTAQYQERAQAGARDSVQRGIREVDRLSASEELKGILTEIETVGYQSKNQEPKDVVASHYYFCVRDPEDMDVLERAQKLLEQLGARDVEIYDSKTKRKNVLRLPMTNVNPKLQKFITEWCKEIAERGIKPSHNYMQDMSGLRRPRI